MYATECIIYKLCYIYTILLGNVSWYLISILHKTIIKQNDNIFFSWFLFCFQDSTNNLTSNLTIESFLWIASIYNNAGFWDGCWVRRKKHDRFIGYVFTWSFSAILIACFMSKIIQVIQFKCSYNTPPG